MKNRSFEQLELDFSASARQPAPERPATLILAYSRPTERREDSKHHDRKLRLFDGLTSYARTLPW